MIVEDEKNISKLIKYNLEKADYECQTVITGEDALDALEQQAVDLVILDIMLPKMDGLEVCRRLKSDPHLKQIPVIMLTAKGEEIDRIVGLELGADDYMVKPFSPRELVLRIKSVLKRGKTAEAKKDILRSADILLDNARHQVSVGEKKIDLTAMEFKLLAVLMERQGRVQSRDQLLSDVWGLESDVYTRTVDTHIKRLREKLGKSGKSIETVIGVGYRLKQQDNDD